MCGIAGVIERGEDPARASRIVGRMLDAIAHRGPDGSGLATWREGPFTIALGHRRLAIIDLEGGAQPMRNLEGTHAVTFNGEIYGFRALRAELEARGRRFATRSDTEVALQLLAEHGDEAVVRLDGMFALAAFEPARRRLFLARDRAGIKPLFYAELPGGGLAFASELAALLQHPAIDDAPSAPGYASYFFADYVQPPHTVVRGAKQLPPGHSLVWEDGRLRAPRRFWSVPVSDPAAVAGRSDAALARETWSRLGESVERQMVADVPVGIFLSGGLDSSSVAALAAERSKERLLAFSIGFEDRTFDESEHARRVAQHVGVRHVEETLRERDVLGVVDRALDTLDQPLADPSYLPTFLLSRLAARHVKVVLGGDGGDECWGGYPTYKAHGYARIYGRLPRGVIRGIRAAVDRLPLDDRYQSLEWKLRRFTGRWDDDPVTRHQRWMSSLDLPELARAVPGARGERPATLDVALPDERAPIARAMALDFATYMPGSVLTKVDRASMAHGLEVRPPLLDDAMIDWAFSLPLRYKVRGRTGKYLLKRAARGHVPDAIIDRPKKGFGIPLRAWLRGPLASRVHDVTSRSPAWDTGLLSREAFAKMRDEHMARRADHAKPLWGLLVLDHFLRRMDDVKRRP